MIKLALSTSMAVLIANVIDADETTESSESGKTVTIRGICEDDDEQPITNAKIVLYKCRILSRESPFVLERAQSDSEGRYQFSPVMAPSFQEQVYPSYAVVITAPGKASQMAFVHLNEPTKTQAFKIRPAVALTGRITNPDGQPVVGAQVWTRQVFDDPLQDALCSVTDADGRYAINDLFAITVKGPVLPDYPSFSSVWVRHPDYVQQQSSYTKAPGTLDFVLSWGAAIEGRLVDTVTGSPAANVVVQLGPKNRSAERWRFVKTDEKGRYKISSLAPVEHVIVVRAPDRACAALESIPVRARETTEAPDMQLVNGAIIEGRVLGPGGQPLSRRPPRGTPLRLRLRGPSCPDWVALQDWHPVDENGQFRIRVAPGLNFIQLEEDLWRRTQRHDEYEKGFELTEGEARKIFFRILLNPPPPNPFHK